MSRQAVKLVDVDKNTRFTEADMLRSIARHRFIITLEPVPDVDGIRALRLALKALKRSFGLRCTHARQVAAEPCQPSCATDG